MQSRLRIIYNPHTVTLTPNTMTYEQACEQIAKENNFNLDRSYDSELFYNSNGHYTGQVAKLYATEKVKEALRVAAERAEAFIGVNDEPLVAKGSILSLETELVENINKEK